MARGRAVRSIFVGKSAETQAEAARWLDKWGVPYSNDFSGLIMLDGVFAHPGDRIDYFPDSGEVVIRKIGTY